MTPHIPITSLMEEVTINNTCDIWCTQTNWLCIPAETLSRRVHTEECEQQPWHMKMMRKVMRRDIQQSRFSSPFERRWRTMRIEPRALLSPHDSLAHKHYRITLYSLGTSLSQDPSAPPPPPCPQHRGKLDCERCHMKNWIIIWVPWDPLLSSLHAAAGATLQHSKWMRTCIHRDSACPRLHQLLLALLGMT